MAAKKISSDKKKEVAAARSDNSRIKDEPLEYLTPSQRNNRLGKGRGKNGSDGSSTEGRGSNH